METFEELYAAYYETVYRYALSLCRRADLAEELTQETFFRALQHVRSFRGECRLDVWLCQIAKNLFRTHAAKESRRMPLTEQLPADEDLVQALTDAQTALHLHELLHRMDEPYKEVFWMRVFGELSFREIARIFGKTEGWARVAYHRAKAKLKEEL